MQLVTANQQIPASEGLIDQFVQGPQWLPIPKEPAQEAEHSMHTWPGHKCRPVVVASLQLSAQVGAVRAGRGKAG